LNATLEPGVAVEFLVSPGYGNPMQWADIREVSAKGTVISPFQDWYVWEQSQKNKERLFAIFPALFGLIYWGLFINFAVKRVT
jgi:hypothetical protein